MKVYFETQIADGNVKSLTCPHDKCDEQALPAQVLNLVGLDVFNRYDSLLLKDSLNNMSDIVYCPRVNCQCAVIPVRYKRYYLASISIMVLNSKDVISFFERPKILQHSLRSTRDTSTGRHNTFYNKTYYNIYTIRFI
jgi:hypothetical protein